MSDKKRISGRLMNENELAALKAKLDLPDHVIEFLRHQPRLSAMAYGAGVVVYIVLMIVLVLLPMIMYSPGFGRFLLDAGFLPQATILVELNFVAPLIALLGGIFFAGYLLCAGSRFLPVMYKRSIVSNLYQAIAPRQRYQSLGVAIIKWFLKGIDRNLPPQEYLIRYERQQARMYWRASRLLYLIAFIFLALDIKSAGRATPDGIILSPYFSFRMLSYKWKGVLGVQTSCKTYDGKTTEYLLGYKLKLSDGREINLGNYKALRTSKIDALETVDGRLSALGVPKVKGQFDQSCLDAKRSQYGRRDYERLERLLRGNAA